MIEFKNVSLSYGKKEILKNVSFACKKGKITAIIGKNGAGKTSLLSCLIGERRYSGIITIDGIDVKSLQNVQRAQRIACLSQRLPDTPFTVSELTALGRRPYRNAFKKLTVKDEEIIRRAMETADVASFSNRPVNTLSGGEKQRAFFSMVLAQDTDVIALDEAAAYMDACVENEMYDIIQALSKDFGKTIIFVTHNLTRAANHADEIVIVDGGKVRAQMDRENNKNTSLIEEIFHVKKYTMPDQTIVYL